MLKIRQNDRPNTFQNVVHPLKFSARDDLSRAHLVTVSDSTTVSCQYTLDCYFCLTMLGRPRCLHRSLLRCRLWCLHVRDVCSRSLKRLPLKSMRRAKKSLKNRIPQDRPSRDTPQLIHPVNYQHKAYARRSGLVR